MHRRRRSKPEWNSSKWNQARHSTAHWTRHSTPRWTRSHQSMSRGYCCRIIAGRAHDSAIKSLLTSRYGAFLGGSLNRCAIIWTYPLAQDHTLLQPWLGSFEDVKRHLILRVLCLASLRDVQLAVENGEVIDSTKNRNATPFVLGTRGGMLQGVPVIAPY